VVEIPAKLYERLAQQPSLLANGERKELLENVKAALEEAFIWRARRLDTQNRRGIELTIVLHLFGVEDEGAAS
jgi:hypothetical protein